MPEPGLPTWRFKNLKVGFDCEATIVAYWEASLDPISDDFAPEEADAEELLARWVERVQGDYPNGLIPIHWFVDVDGTVKTFNLLPFQYQHLDPIVAEDFLTFFTWPQDGVTGRPLNWNELPVVDKLWRPGRPDKGGFIQEATGWKPAIYQPYVYLPSLREARRAD